MSRVTSCLSHACTDLQNAYSKARFVVTVEPILAVFMLGSNLQYVAIQQLLYLKTCMFEYNNTDLCSNLSDHKTEEERVQTLTSHWLIILNGGLTVASVLSTLFLGAWSDRVGRRVCLIIPCVGSIVNAILLIFSSLNIFMPIWYIVLGSILLGMTGGFSLILSSVFSYMSDLVTVENRTMRFAILESMTFIGSFIGLLTVGVVIDKAGFVAAFSYYIGCNAVPILYILLWLPESLPTKATPRTLTSNGIDDDTKELVDELDGRVASELGNVGNHKTRFCAEFLRVENMKGAVRTVFRKRPHFQRLQLLLLILCVTLFQFVGSGEGDTTVLYLKKSPLEFTASQISYYLGLKNCVVGATLLIGMPLLRMTSIRDTTIACIGIFGEGSIILLAFSRNLAMVFSVAVIMAPAAMPAVATRSMLSKLVSSSEQGSLFSFVASMESLMVFISSAFFNWLYPETLHVLEGGFVYLVMAIILIFPFILMFWIRDLKNVEMEYQIQRQEDSNDSAVPVQDYRPHNDSTV
ncbi:LOW QUALITY PROTEIN: proton-coupled folate transporter-like [Amphiura filiformis]|uniref:LOW QUALITY PROTEIN: proton-coupled folate transporter-like n=1 Tax=Amphiura filiformis TaxID=82378 RepID=UPI003B212A2F